MSIKITIEETKDVVVEEQGAYTALSSEYISRHKYTDLPYDEQKSWKAVEGDQYEKKVYDYPPKRTVTKQITTKLFEQVVTGLDLKKVIQSILDSQD
jgi:hypothetical protein